MRDSRWFKEGQVAAEQCEKEGKVGAVCPYGVNSAKFYLWNEGFTDKVIEGYSKTVDTPAVSA